MMHVEKDVNLDQLAGELEVKVGHRVGVLAQHDEDGKPIAVDAETDPDALAECVEDHVAVWPEPPPDPIDVLDAELSTTDINKVRKALRKNLIPILRDLRERSDP